MDKDETDWDEVFKITDTPFEHVTQKQLDTALKNVINNVNEEDNLLIIGYYVVQDLKSQGIFELSLKEFDAKIDELLVGKIAESLLMGNDDIKISISEDDLFFGL